MSPSQGVTHFSDDAVHCYMYSRHTLHCKLRLLFNNHGEHIQYTVTCSEPLVPVTVELELVHQSMCYVVIVIIHRLMCLNNWSSIPNETWSTTPGICACRLPTDTSQWRSHIVIVKQEVRNSCKFAQEPNYTNSGTLQYFIPINCIIPLLTQVTSVCRCSSSMGTVLQITLQMISYYMSACGHVKCFHARCVQCPQQAPLGIDKPDAICKCKYVL